MLERKQSICASGWKEKDHQRKLQRVTPPLVQGVFAPMAEGKTPLHNLQPVTTTVCVSGVLALVDRRITPQAQGAKVRVQGAKVRVQGASARAQGAKVRTSISASW